jgi:hypothetical protein
VTTKTRCSAPFVWWSRRHVCGISKNTTQAAFVTPEIKRRLIVEIGTEVPIRTKYDFPRWRNAFVTFEDPSIFRASSGCLFWGNPTQSFVLVCCINEFPNKQHNTLQASGATLCTSRFEIKLDRQRTCKVTLRSFRETVFAVQKQLVLHISVCVYACARVRGWVYACRLWCVGVYYRACRLIYPAFNALVPYCLRPVWLHIFRHYLISYTIFGKKLQSIKCVCFGFLKICI